MATKKTVPAKKAAAPVKPVVLKKPKFKVGGIVEVRRSGVLLGKGRYVGSEQKTNGEWHCVNMTLTARHTPDVRTYRAAALTRV